MYLDAELITIGKCGLLVVLGMLITLDLALYSLKNKDRKDIERDPFLDSEGNHKYYERSLIEKGRFFLSHPNIPKEKIRSFRSLFSSKKLSIWLYLVAIISGLAIHNSADAHNAVRLTDGAGNETVFLLNEGLKVSTEGTILLIETNNDNIQLAIEDGNRFEFIDYDDTGVGTIEANKPFFKIKSGIIEGGNLAPQSFVILTDTTGKTIFRGMAGPDGNLSIPIGELPMGVYVLSCKERQIKIYKR